MIAVLVEAQYPLHAPLELGEQWRGSALLLGSRAVRESATDRPSVLLEHTAQEGSVVHRPDEHLSLLAQKNGVRLQNVVPDSDVHLIAVRAQAMIQREERSVDSVLKLVTAANDKNMLKKPVQFLDTPTTIILSVTAV